MAPMAPTAFTQPLSVPTMPMTSPMADPTTGALHLPTLQAIHRMQQQTSPAPVLVQTMPRDPMEYTQTNFPALTPRQLAVLAQLEMQDQQALRSSAHNVLQPSLQTMAGRPVQNTAPGQTQPASTTTRLLEAGQDTQLRPSSEPHAAPRRERQTRRLPSQDRSRSHTRPQHRRRRHPEATVVTADHAAMVHAEPIDTDPGPPGPDPQAVTAVTGPLCYAADPNLASCQCRTCA